MNLRELELCAVDNFDLGDRRHRKQAAHKGRAVATAEAIEPGRALRPPVTSIGSRPCSLLIPSGDINIFRQVTKTEAR